MARISGFFEWDDDDLTPGNKREGGLHQNLYDRDGKLKGNARFIPREKPDRESSRQPSNPRGGKGGRGRTRPSRRENAQGHLGEFAGEVGDVLVQVGGLAFGVVQDVVVSVVADLVEEAKPHAKKVWEEQALPAIKERTAAAANDATAAIGQKARPMIERQREKVAVRRAKKAAAKEPIVVEGTVVDSGQ